MRPQILWFDETYNQKYYQVESVGDILDSDVDAVIVVGTALATNLANRIVMSSLRKDILTIDVNLEPVCTAGHSVQVIENAETALRKLFKKVVEKQK
jgi:NAD-dependent SIR2 family protein deacetylase